MRTTIWHIVRLAWELWKHPYRKDLRIGQMVTVSGDDGLDQDPWYLENDELLRLFKQARLTNGRF